MIIALLGPPGTGKGTYAQMLQDEFKIKKIVTGDLCRAEKAKETKSGKEIAIYYDKGSLVPPKIVVKLIEKNLENVKDAVLDGFPRSIEQAELFKGKIDRVFYINSSDKVAVERLGGRRTCRKCNRIYHIKNNPSKVEGKCDFCNGELYVREDETEEAIKERLKEYKKQTAPVIEFYREKGILAEIDGDRFFKEVYRDIRKIYKELKEYTCEDFELADSVTKEIEGSRKKPKSELVSHEEMRKEFNPKN